MKRDRRMIRRAMPCDGQRVSRGGQQRGKEGEQTTEEGNGGRGGKLYYGEMEGLPRGRLAWKEWVCYYCDSAIIIAVCTCTRQRPPGPVAVPPVLLASRGSCVLAAGRPASSAKQRGWERREGEGEGEGEFVSCNRRAATGRRAEEKERREGQ